MSFHILANRVVNHFLRIGVFGSSPRACVSVHNFITRFANRPPVYHALGVSERVFLRVSILAGQLCHPVKMPFKSVTMLLFDAVSIDAIPSSASGTTSGFNKSSILNGLLVANARDSSPCKRF